MENWENRVLNQMEQSLAGIREKDLRFFRIDELKRNISRVANFSAGCPVCLRSRSEIEAALVHLNEAVNVPGPYRRDLDRLIVHLGKHMMKSHQLYPPWYFNYLYSFYGIMAGSLAGLLLVLAIPEKPWEILAAGFVTGLLAGQFTGARKDRTVREENRLM
jgi:hypothetical protein